MPLVTANNVGVISGTIVRPLVGVWTADLKLDQTGGTPTGFTPGTQVTIATEGGYSIVGVVDPNRGGSFLDSVHVRIVGGAGGMSTLATARAYGNGAYVRDVINGLMRDSGETLSSQTDAGLLATRIGGWSVMAHTVGWNLRALLRVVAPTMNWRHLADGTLWIGNESWAAASATFDAITQDPADGSYVLGVEAPFVVPGTSISGLGNVNRCIDVVEHGKMRTHVYVDFPSEGTRGIMASISRMVTQATSGIDYLATYLCEVVSQSQDLTTVDLKPHNARAKQLMPQGWQAVPVHFGSGVKFQIPTGAIVFLSWDGGDARYPFAWGGQTSNSAQAIQLAGTHPAPLWDTFMSDFAAWLALVNTVVQSNCAAPGSPLVGAAAFATAIALPTSLVQKLSLATNYQSQIVSNG